MAAGRPADDGAGRRRLVFLCGGEYREVEGRYMGAVASPARGHGWSGPFIILHWLLGYVTHLGWTMISQKTNTVDLIFYFVSVLRELGG